MCFPDETHVTQAQIPKASVDELRRGTRGRAAKITCVDERYRKAGARGVSSNPGADDPGADDEQVELPLCKLVDGSSVH